MQLLSRRFWCNMLLLALASPLYANPNQLVFCYEDQDSYPWVMKTHTGLNLSLMNLLQRDLGLHISLLPLPWKRCLTELQASQVDGAFAASFQADRLGMGSYPPGKNGVPDPSLRLHMSSYSLYRLKGSTLDWDGQRFLHLQGSIGIIRSTSIGPFLRQHDVSVDEGTAQPDATLRKVALGYVQGAALQTSRAEWVLLHDTELARKIEAAPLLLQEKPYFLMLSFQLTRQSPQLADKIWQQVAHIRETAEFHHIEYAFYNGN